MPHTSARHVRPTLVAFSEQRAPHAYRRSHSPYLVYRVAPIWKSVAANCRKMLATALRLDIVEAGSVYPDFDGFDGPFAGRQRLERNVR